MVVSDWGITVQSVDIQDVTIPDDLQDAMSRQAQAVQESAARVTLAGSEVAVAQKTVEAARLYDEAPTAFKLRQMQLAYELGQNSNTILLPTMLADGFSSGVAASSAMKNPDQ